MSEKPPEYDSVVLEPPCYDDAIKLSPSTLLQSKPYKDAVLPSYSDLDVNVNASNNNNNNVNNNNNAFTVITIVQSSSEAPTELMSVTTTDSLTSTTTTSAASTTIMPAINDDSNETTKIVNGESPSDVRR